MESTQVNTRNLFRAPPTLLPIPLYRLTLIVVHGTPPYLVRIPCSARIIEELRIKLVLHAWYKSSSMDANHFFLSI